MSTRCQVILKDEYGELWFYRHSDGYPDGTMPALEQFMSWVKEGRIRDNVEQAGGWLILIGAKEYVDEVGDEPIPWFEPGKDSRYGWKCGAFEPCTPIRHGDIEYLYTINLTTKEIKCEEV